MVLIHLIIHDVPLYMCYINFLVLWFVLHTSLRLIHLISTDSTLFRSKHYYHSVQTNLSVTLEQDQKIVRSQTSGRINL